MPYRLRIPKAVQKEIERLYLHMFSSRIFTRTIGSKAYVVRVIKESLSGQPD